MPQEPWRFVVDELRQRAAHPAPRRRPRGAPRPPRLSVPVLSSVRVLSERRAGDRQAVALTVEDATHERYLIIRELVRDHEQDSGWRHYGGSEGPDRVIPDKPEPYVSLYAYADGHFFAGGQVQSPPTELARARLVWGDGYAIEDEIQNGVALFFGARDALEPATVEFLDEGGQVIASHVTFIDEPPPNAESIPFHRSPATQAREAPDHSGPGQSRVVFTREPAPSGDVPLLPLDGASVRAATPADVAAVLEFWRVAAEDDDRPADRREAVEGLIARDPDALMLLVNRDGILGCVVIGWDGWRAHLYRLAVHPGFRRRGIGRWLLQIAEQRLRAAGAIRIDAMVLDANKSAHGLWSAAGYLPQDNWSRWIKPL
jgi:ribosomal protein S18 acetylase RimI-like enzyme